MSLWLDKLQRAVGILDRVNAKVIAATKINQWKNTSAVIDWFNTIENKEKHRFICFDIVEFYPSTSENLLNKALDFATAYDTITQRERNIINQAKSSLLTHKKQQWQKRSPSPFDVTMGSYDGAETCELVGCYLLSQLQSQRGIKIGLYRDDGLAVCDATPRETEKIKKHICKIFKDNGLSITIEANKHSINFLDVTFNLPEGRYSPYTKPNATLLYVNRESNHPLPPPPPPSIIKNISAGINRRLSSISSDRESFEKAVPPYQRALDASGYNHTLKFEPPRASPRRNGQRKNTLWYNPPFSKSVQTDIGKKLLILVDKCFPHKNPLRKIFNRNTVKISYSCTSNIKQAIDNHNKQKLAAYNGENTNPEEANAKLCNCRKKDSCPLNGEYLQPAVIYQAKVTRSDNNQSETYVGLTESEFKTRYRNHTNSFCNAKSKNSTELSKYIWHLKENKIDYDITWSVIGHAKPYNITYNIPYMFV